MSIAVLILLLSFCGYSALFAKRLTLFAKIKQKYQNRDIHTKLKVKVRSQYRICRILRFRMKTEYGHIHTKFSTMVLNLVSTK